MLLKSKFFLLILLSLYSNTSQYDEELNFLSYNPYDILRRYEIGDKKTLKVGIMSDAQLLSSPDALFHNYTQHLYESLRSFKDRHIEVLVFAGDISNRGTKYAFKTFINAFNEVFSDPDAKPILDVIMGNHDYWTLPRIASINQERFENIIGEKPLGHKVINGFHFINWGSKDGTFKLCNKNIEWAKEQIELAIKEDPSKPVFVITHLPPYDTVYGSDDWGNKDLAETLKKYPQVISFSGHTHYPLLDERSIWQGEFTAINTQCIAYIEMEKGKENGSIPKDELGSDMVSRSNPMGMFMEVNDKSITIHRISLSPNEFHPVPWIIDLPMNPSTFRYNTQEKQAKATAPIFEKGTTVKIIKVNKVTQIEFKQAFHENHVHSYRVIFTDSANKQEELLYFSDFFLMQKDRKEYIKLKLPNKLSAKNYTIRVTAIESFGKESEPIEGVLQLDPVNIIL